MAEWIIEVKDGKFPIGKWTKLVRCQDCKYHEGIPHGCWRNPSIEPWEDNDFCSYGERKDEVTE